VGPEASSDKTVPPAGIPRTVLDTPRMADGSRWGSFGPAVDDPEVSPWNQGNVRDDGGRGPRLPALRGAHRVGLAFVGVSERRSRRRTSDGEDERSR